jgi:hypothetical protein
LNSSKPFRQANLSEETLQIESVSKIQPTINASIFINSLELFKDISKEFALSAPLPEFMKNTLKKVIEFMKPQNAYFAVINSSSGQIILEVCENFISPFNNKNMNNPEPELSRIVSEIVQTKKHQFLPDLTVDLRFKDIFKALNCKLSPIILNFFPINDQKSCLFILGFKSSEGDINFNPDYRIYFAETLSYYLGGIITHITTIPSKIINPEPSQLADVSILHDVKNLAEKNLIIEVLKKNSGNITKSAQDLGIARRQLQRLMKKLKLKREEFI